MLFQLDLKHMLRSGMCYHICAAHVSLGIRRDPERPCQKAGAQQAGERCSLTKCSKPKDEQDQESEDSDWE